MCDPGYYGLSCAVAAFGHYALDHMRVTWIPYVCWLLYALAFAAALTFGRVQRR